MEYIKRQLQSLHNQIEQLEAGLNLLPDYCLKQAEIFKERGSPPDPDFINKLTNIRKRFRLIVNKLQLLAKVVPLEGTNKKPDSLNEIKELWHLLNRHFYPNPEEQKISIVQAEEEKTKRQNMVPENVVTISPESAVPGTSVPDPVSRKLNKKKIRWIKPEIIFDLIKDAKLGPAFWFACYCEYNYGRSPVPSWLIKSVEIADVICGEEGPAAEWLSYMYKNHDYEGLCLKGSGNLEPVKQDSPLPDPAVKIGFNLLVFSALLRPALLAPASGALSILGRLGGLPEGLGKLAAVLQDRRFAEDDVLTGKLALLRNDMEAWYKQNRKLTLASNAASEIWSSMQEKGGIIFEILSAIQENRVDSLEQIRKLCNNLKEKENLKDEIIKLFGGLPERHVPGLWQIINRSRGALKLADRWVKLQDKDEDMVTIAGGPGSAGDKLLSEEIRKILPAAREDLKAIAVHYKEFPLVEAGLSAARRSLDSLEELFTKGLPASLSVEEITRLETSSNPQLLINLPWRPKRATAESMVYALLGLLKERTSGRYAEQVEGYVSIGERTSP